MKNLSIALVTLALLSACGQRGASPDTGDKPGAAEQGGDSEAAATAAAMAQEEKAQAAAVQAGAKRVVDYKRVLLPLVAATYAGNCTNKAGVKSQAAVTIGADGMVTAPGMKGHSIMDADSLLTITRATTGGKQTPVGFVAGGDGEAWTVGNTSPTPNAIMYSDKADGVQCVDTAATTKGGEVYPLLAKFFSAGARTMKCIDGSLIAKNARIVPAATSLAIGGDSFALVGPGLGEMVIVDAPKGALSFQVGVIDGERVHMLLGRDGLLEAVAVLGGASGKTINCSVEQ
jgi:hypothetical protein